MARVRETARIAGNVLAWFGSLAAPIRRFRERERLRSELAGLERRGELDAVLRDAGLLRAQWPTVVAAHPDASELLAGMLARLGIERRHLGSTDTEREIGWTCTTCADKRRCRDWVSDGRTDPREYRSFCPNRRNLDAGWRRAAVEKTT